MREVERKGEGRRGRGGEGGRIRELLKEGSEERRGGC